MSLESAQHANKTLNRWVATRNRCQGIQVPGEQGAGVKETKFDTTSGN